MDFNLHVSMYDCYAWLICILRYIIILLNPRNILKLNFLSDVWNIWLFILFDICNITVKYDKKFEKKKILFILQRMNHDDKISTALRKINGDIEINSLLVK